MAGRRARHRALLAMIGAATLAVVLAACSVDERVAIDAPAPIDAALPDATVESLQAAVTQAMEGSGSPGAIVGVWAPWSGSWVTGIGTDQVEGGADVTADMQFRAGPVTRAMTCDVLYEVVAEGKAELDDSVSDYVAGMPDLKDVTLGQLCDSTSGIGTYSSTLTSMWLTNPERSWHPQELASFGLGKKRTAEPGAAYASSDAGYLVLGMALERITGESASAMFREYITDPLNLDATGLGDSTYGDQVLSGLLSRKTDGRLNCAEPTDVTSVSSTTGFTDSGVITDIEDLGVYARALASGALVSDDMKRFDDPKPPAKDSPSWFTTTAGTFQAGSLIGQYGAVPGYATAAFSDPDTGLTVAVVLNNSAAGGTYVRSLAFELAAIASKAPAAEGQSAPEAGLPWTAEQYHARIADTAVCAAPAK